MSPGASTQRSTSESSSSGQRTSTITLPGGWVFSLAASPGGLRWGSRSRTIATNPASASMITSRKTVPPSSSSSCSSVCMALALLDDGGDQRDRAALEETVVGHEPDVEDGADQSGVERDRHAADQGRDHRPDRFDVGRGLGVDPGQRNDEADHGTDQAQNHETVREVPDRGDARRQLELQRRSREPARVPVAALNTEKVAPDPTAGSRTMLLQLVDLDAGLPDLARAAHETEQEHGDDHEDQSGRVARHDDADPALGPRRAEQRERDQVQDGKAQQQQITVSRG